MFNQIITALIIFESLLNFCVLSRAQCLPHVFFIIIIHLSNFCQQIYIYKKIRSVFMKRSNYCSIISNFYSGCGQFHRSSTKNTPQTASKHILLIISYQPQWCETEQECWGDCSCGEVLW